MKIVTKCTGYHNYLVYLKDDNDNSLECIEITGDNAVEDRVKKEEELMLKHGITSCDYSFVDLEQFMLEQYNDGIPYEAPKDYPLVLVFYLDREMMGSEIMGLYAQSVNDTIAARKANMMAFFLPTDGEERIECINPKQVAKADMGKINVMVEEIAKQFDVGQVKLGE